MGVHAGGNKLLSGALTCSESSLDRSLRGCNGRPFRVAPAGFDSTARRRPAVGPLIRVVGCGWTTLELTARSTDCRAVVRRCASTRRAGHPLTSRPVPTARERRQWYLSGDRPRGAVPRLALAVLGRCARARQAGKAKAPQVENGGRDRDDQRADQEALHAEHHCPPTIPNITGRRLTRIRRPISQGAAKLSPGRPAPRRCSCRRRARRWQSRSAR
jgi:hypothetical protein